MGMIPISIVRYMALFVFIRAEPEESNCIHLDNDCAFWSGEFNGEDAWAKKSTVVPAMSRDASAPLWSSGLLARRTKSRLTGRVTRMRLLAALVPEMKVPSFAAMMLTRSWALPLELLIVVSSNPTATWVFFVMAWERAMASASATDAGASPADEARAKFVMAGTAPAAKMPMMAMTVSSSRRENPPPPRGSAIRRISLFERLVWENGFTVVYGRRGRAALIFLISSINFWNSWRNFSGISKVDGADG